MRLLSGTDHPIGGVIVDFLSTTSMIEKLAMRKGVNRELRVERSKAVL
jgi:hypothetical protein